jgi:hypothetical protein
MPSPQNENLDGNWQANYNCPKKWLKAQFAESPQQYKMWWNAFQDFTQE